MGIYSSLILNLFNCKMWLDKIIIFQDNEEISMQDLVGENRDRFYLSHLDLAFRVAVAK